MQAEIIILGSGTSMGVPTLGCGCRVCTSTDPRNARTRPSIAIRWNDHTVVNNHTVVIDTGPDFRQQALREKIDHVDAILYTHAHADHILGLDDLRPLSFRHPNRLPLYADDPTADVLRRVFEYTFAAHAKYPTRARVDLRHINGHEFATVADAQFQRVPLLHGDLTVSGFRFGSAAYLTDMSTIPDSSLPLLENLDVLIIDALRPQPHPWPGSPASSPAAPSSPTCPTKSSTPKPKTSCPHTSASPTMACAFPSRYSDASYPFS
jgi:phosphoribosyl 1,2-cyclic phosphate phosphodiesterase